MGPFGEALFSAFVHLCYSVFPGKSERVGNIWAGPCWFLFVQTLHSMYQNFPRLIFVVLKFPSSRCWVGEICPVVDEGFLDGAKLHGPVSPLSARVSQFPRDFPRA